jgi:hypothetical protein
MNSFPQEISTTRALSITFAGLIILEAIVVHVLLSHYSPLLTAVLDGLSLLTLLYLVVDAHRLGRAAITIDATSVYINNGLRGNVTLARSEITELTEGEIDTSHPENISLAPSDSSTVIFMLAAPRMVTGPFNTKRSVKRIGVAPASIDALRKALKGQ